MANNPYDLAKLLADISSGPKTYVVPNNQTQTQPQLQQPIPRSQIRYGEEVPRQSSQQVTAALVDAIGSYQRANPPKVTLPAGTKSLASKKFDYEKEQFEYEKERFEREWPYKEASYAYDLNKPYYAPSNSSAGAGGNSTAAERKNFATRTLFDSATSRYDELKKNKYKHPLYYTISSLLSDPEWIGPSTEAGADRITTINDLIRAKTKMTPEEYFNTETGSKLASLYNSLAGIGDEETDNPINLLD
jgi:hypothetical protein